jgi:hypothetical protein
VILVSSAIDFLDTQGGGLDKFIAVLIAFSRLSIADNGILDSTNGKPFIENGALLVSNEVQKHAKMQENKTLKLKDNKGEFTVTYGKVISHDPSLAGRGTSVLQVADCSRAEWSDDLVIKISWPGEKRIAEQDFITKARNTAKSDKSHAWAFNHLPKVFYARDIVFDSNSTQGRLAALFEHAIFADAKFHYEKRVLRIIIQERLRPLKTLANVRHVAQVLLDVACSMYFQVI